MTVWSTTSGVSAIDGDQPTTDPAPPATESYEALAVQQGLLFHNRYEPGSGVDIIQVAIDWPEPLEPAAFDTAWQHAADRHAALRTAFTWQHGETIQQVHPRVTLPIERYDWSTDAREHQTERLTDFLTADRSREFDPSTAPLVRVSVIDHAPDQHTVVFSLHHAVLDGRSIHQLLHEVLDEYRALCQGTSFTPPTRRSFQDFAVWASRRDLADDREFWQTRLADLPLPTPLPLQPATELPPRTPDSVREITTTLSRTASADLMAAAAAVGVPLGTLVTAAWAVLLHRYGGGDDVVFGATRTCRQGTIEQAETIIGLMINTVPMRITVDTRQTVRDWLVDVRAQIDMIRGHQLTPLPAIGQWLGLPSASPLFESLLMYEHRDLQTALAASVDGWAGRTTRVHRHPGAPLTVCVFGEPDLQVLIYHDRRRFSDAAADRLLRHLTTCLTGIAAGLDAPVSALPLLAPEEIEQLTGAWAGAAATPYPADTSIPERFAAQARQSPDAVAVTGPDGTLTYAELDAQANRLAHLLIRHGIRPDHPVAVALPRSVRLVTALLAVLKAGAAYLPLDPADPPARIRDLLAGGGNPLVLTTDEAAAPLPPEHPTIRLDRIAAEVADLPPAAPEVTVPPAGLAYISHTSGSTGAPKGVAVPHRAVLRLIHEPDYLRLGPDETVLQLAPVAFDAATLEIWGSLLNGARLVVAPAGPLGPTEIARLLRAEQISVLWLTAGLFHQIVEQDPESLAGVGQLLAGGDVLDADAVRTALRVRRGQPVVNGYGPTENTTFTCCHRMTDPDAVPDSVPIGRPVPRSTVYVLDPQLRPVPVGVPGELFTGGDGLARGYLGRPAATGERFLPDPFTDTPGARMYRTGDRVRWRPDGTLEFLGRIDRQVKIRGFRVEPAEVEAVLRTHPRVGDVAVVVDGDGERRRLLAYLAPGAGAGPSAGRAPGVGAAPGTGPEPLEPADLEAYAATHLPPYLRPAAYLVLPELPLNRNGKVDRAALPAPTTAPAPPVVPLTDATQTRLAALWSELLGVAVRNAGDDFFALGGNSLLATRLTFLVSERFGVELPIRVVYDQHELAGLAAEIDRRRTASASASTGTGTGTGPKIIARDRRAYRHTGPTNGHVNGQLDGAGAPAPGHLVRPTPGPWAMWRWVGLRGAGFPVEPLTRLGDLDHLTATDAVLASADRVDAARRQLTDLLYQARRAGDPEQRSRWNRADRQVRQGSLPDALPEAAEPALRDALSVAIADLTAVRAQLAADRLHFDRSHEQASARRSAGLRAAAGAPLFREAVTWQNRHALRTGIDALLAHNPATDAARGSKHRQHEALVASYLQRYCAKNDTIGFFGPVGWATVDPHQDTLLRMRHGVAPLATRTVYFENWAVTGLAEALAEREPRLRPWLIPRRLPFLSVLDDQLLLPLTPPTPLPHAVARLLAACDGIRPAGEIAAELVADPTVEVSTPEEVYQLLAELRDARRVSWSLEIPKEDLFPERALRQRLATVTDPAISGPALAALDRLEQARDAVAAAAGDADRVGAALAELEQTFTELTGAAPTRRAGRVYAGRTLVYEDCRSGTEVSLSPELTATLWPALSLLLESARWFTFAGAALFRRACVERYQELVARTGQTSVPFTDFWLWANDLLFDLPEKLIAPVVRGLRDRWASILPELAGQRRVQVDSAEIADRAATAFAAPRPGWVGAYQHSPDVMLVADGAEAVARGDFQWVVGEVHPGVNTLRSALFVAQHPDPEQLVAAMRTDLPGPRVALAATGEEGGAPSRITDKLITERDLRLMFGHDSCGLDPKTAAAVADCVLEPQDGTLVVRTRDGRHVVPLAEMIGETIMLQLLQRFDILPPGDHQPRITVDRVTIARESWRFRAAELDFARTADEAERFQQVRRWQLAAGLPRYVFVKTPVEKKPFFLDFASLAAVDWFARSIRRTVDGEGPTATLRLTEMLPSPDQLWLTDPAGGRRTAEFRLVAVDTRDSMAPREGSDIRHTMADRDSHPASKRNNEETS
ncbi:amino acid adenylation domain-containing protein [Micromonospora sp. NPDC003197]